jgi:hypothetical protein
MDGNISRKPTGCLFDSETGVVPNGFYLFPEKIDRAPVNVNVLFKHVM